MYINRVDRTLPEAKPDIKTTTKKSPGGDQPDFADAIEAVLSADAIEVVSSSSDGDSRKKKNPAKKNPTEEAETKEAGGKVDINV